ncbi:MAG TPA: hypothetical protein DEP84_22320 [Chloroflexi bacterium]|nr:hypothetical protein [Chloroflexota bacterium]
MFAATTAAAAVLGLDASSVARAYGIAAEHAPVPASLMGLLDQRPLSSMKNNAGWVCLGGVLATELARTGIFASPAIFDPQARLWMRVGSDRYAQEKLVAGLGDHYHILDVSLKPYPCCRYLHTTLDVLTQIMQTHALRADDVARVHVRGFTRLSNFQEFEPQTVLDAQYSLPYAVAMVLLGRRPGYEWQDPALLRDPKVIRTARKLTVGPDPAADKVYFNFNKRLYPTTVRVELTDGTCHESSASIPQGDPRNFMPLAAVIAKFTGLVEPVLGATAACALADRIETLEACQNVAALSEDIYTLHAAHAAS